MARYHQSVGSRLFDVANAGVLLLVAAACLFPLVFVFLTSVTPGTDFVGSGHGILPHKLTFYAYRMVWSDPLIRAGYFNTIMRTLFGTLATLAVTAIVAYPLSRRRFRARSWLVLLVVFTVVFTGGMFPKYLLINDIGLINNRLVYVLPIMLTGFNVIILRNFFAAVPDSIEEAARIDGAGDWTILVKIFVPLSIPALVTIGLWTAVLHWNLWFDGLLYITDDSKQVMQVMLQRIVVEGDVNRLRFGAADLDAATYSAEAVKAAAIVINTVPLVILYLLLQRFFVKGITLGGLKE
jgi:putative aldouronate transport system permease protein